MKILKAIGSFFAKIWRWIKNTAWVQPLLIVGAIFGVIFSIPSITGAIQGAINNKNSADTFYEKFKKSLEGGSNSPAQKLLSNYGQAAKEGASILSKDEKKYFIMFTSKGNATAKEIKDGFQVLHDNWNSFNQKAPEYTFKLYTIFTDEVTTSTTTTESAFAQFMRDKNWFFEQASQVGQESVYLQNGGVTKADLEKMEACDPDNFINPTIMLVDWTETVTPSKKGITQVMFNVTGTNSYDKAKTLNDCWNCENLFEKIKS